MAFLKNAWYVAAWSDDVTTALFHRKILGEPVLMYRTTEGHAVALSDRCPHRFAPLHLGTLKNDTVQCRYHGLTFDQGGKCVHNPQSCSGATPPKAFLRHFPLVERYSALWIWMGEEKDADESTIPCFNFLDQPQRYATAKGYIYSKGNYELMNDNILDLSHVDFLHPTSLGCEATAGAKVTISQTGNTVQCDRWMANDFQGPLTSMIFDRVGKRVDCWVNVRWDPPANLYLVFGITDVGDSPAEGRELLNVHWMTPEDEQCTHYFWASGRDFRVDDHELTAQFQTSIQHVFVTEDKLLIEAQQEMMGASTFESLRPVLLPGDAASVRVRRTLATLISAE